MTRVVAIVQARTGSRRLPGKVLMDLAGAPLIARVLERAAAADRVDEVVCATSDRAGDDELAATVRRLGFRCHRGSESDVLGRYRAAADEGGADVVVRVTGDCPLADPDVIDAVAGEAVEHAAACDLASNILRRTFPKGLDVEALPVDVLHRLDRIAPDGPAREHVTWLAYRERPDLFELRSVEHAEDHSQLNWSVDEPADLERVRALYARHGLAEERRPWVELL